MAHKHLYWVTLGSQTREGAPKLFRFVFACELPNVVALGEELRAHGIVYGQRLLIGDDGKGNRHVRGREDYMFGTVGVLTIQAYQHEVAGL